MNADDFVNSRTMAKLRILLTGELSYKDGVRCLRESAAVRRSRTVDIGVFPNILEISVWPANYLGR